MAVAFDQFVKQLEDSGVISSGKLAGFLPPNAHPKDAQELARQLVQSKHLTKYQAQEVYAGRARGLILGNYTILDKIGAGGMGQVFKAEHRRMRRIVALKTLPSSITKDPVAIARFQREVEAAAKLRHTNIVAADDADEAHGVHFLVMEYVEGIDLSALVKKNGPCSVDDAVSYIAQAARGLEYAHSEGVIHRDIKPSNLLVDRKGTVKILDMGLARIQSSAAVATQAELTGTGAVMGTVDYMSPEQAVSTKDADARADIYSLGCTLFYLLTGQALYSGETVVEKLLAHQTKPIPELAALRPGVPDGVKAIFRRMVAKRVVDRYQSMSEVIAELSQCQAGPPQATSTTAAPVAAAASDSALSSFLQHVPQASATRTGLKPTVQLPAKPMQVAAANVAPGSRHRRQGMIVALAAAAALAGVLLAAAAAAYFYFTGSADEGAVAVSADGSTTTTPTAAKPPPLAVAPFDEATAKHINKLGPIT